MELLSSSSQSESSVDELQPAKVRIVYSITYSQAELSIFPDRQSFADGVCEAVLNYEGPKLKVVQRTKQDQEVAADMAIFKEQVECLRSLFKPAQQLLSGMVVQHQRR